MIAPLLALTALFLGDARVPDRVELADGSVLEGRVLLHDADGVVVRVGTKERALEPATVKSVYARMDNQREALRRWIELSRDDAEGVLDLMHFCQRHDLAEELELCAWWIVLLRPDEAEAHEILRHEKVKTSWMAREGGRRVELDKYLKSHADWNSPWELRSTHYVVRTNLPLRDAITVAFELECHYRAFMECLAGPVRILEVTEPMLANVHADARSFPELGDDRVAYFNASSRSLVVDASRGLDVRVLMHEATHALLFATAVATRSSTGVIPAWIDEGLAEYMSATMIGDRGRLRFDAGGLLREHFTTQARAKDPYDLSRLLNFGSTDFAASSRADLKYAQAYTLVHFGLHAERGAYRDRFHAFLRGCYAGQASQTHFKDALRMEAPQIERAWSTHVKALAGP